MQSMFETWEATLQSVGTISERISQCFDLSSELGFDALLYDFAPIPQTPEGQILVPNVLQTRNMPSEMPDLWCRQGYYRHDPVHRLALGISRPFFWSYSEGEPSAIRDLLGDDTSSVTGVMRDWRMSRGITMPLHMPGNRFATLTGFWRDDSFAEKGGRPGDAVMTVFAALAQVLQDHLTPLYGAREMTPSGVVLTPRERQCLGLAAQGLATKQMAWKLRRSESMVVMHLQSAMRKLGARNRVQAVARAAHYGYLTAEVELEHSPPRLA